MRPSFIILFMISAINLFGQCDPDTYNRLLKTLPPFTLLKRYSVPAKGVGDAPFAVQYSYVLTKTNTYGFYVLQTDNHALPVIFTLTNSKEQLVDYDTVQDFGKEGRMFIYTPELTGVYYLNVYSSKPTNGCVMLQLSYTASTRKALAKPNNVAKHKLDQSDNPGKNRELKKFELAPNSTSRYACALTAGKTYEVIFIDKMTAEQLGVTITSYGGEQLKSKMRTEDTGLVYLIKPKETDLHYFSFFNYNPSTLIKAHLYEVYPDQKGIYAR
jgi:hypothetical protein